MSSLDVASALCACPSAFGRAFLVQLCFLVSCLESALPRSSGSVHSKRLPETLSPLESALPKKRGGGPPARPMPACPDPGGEFRPGRRDSSLLTGQPTRVTQRRFAPPGELPATELVLSIPRIASLRASVPLLLARRGGAAEKTFLLSPTSYRAKVAVTPLGTGV